MAKSLTLNLVNAGASSYDPMSPSYDPNAASPCNPFPTKSPFLAVNFKKSQRSSVSSSLNSSSLMSSLQSMSLLGAGAGPQQQASTMPILPFLKVVPPPHSAPSLRRTKPCRFYLGDGCKSGRWCNFKHPVDTRSTSETVRDVRDVDPDWGIEADGDVHPKYRTQPCKNFMLGLCRFGDKCQFIHPPDIVSSLAVYPPPLDYFGLAGLACYGNVSPPGGLNVNPLSRPAQPVAPCSNFEMDGECSHGSACQFIHMPKTTGARRFKVQIKKNGSNVVVHEEKKEEVDLMDVRAEHESPPPPPPRGRPIKKPTGAIKAASGVHKPTWRVVGGGVPLAVAVPPAKKRQDSIVSVVSSSQSSMTTGSQSPLTNTSSSPSPSSISLPSPEDYLCIDSVDGSIADLSQFDFATPTHFVNQADFLRPPSPDVPLDITMGSPELYDMHTSAVHLGPRKRVFMTGDDLIRQMREDSLDDGINSPTIFPVPRRHKSKPQLTIHVPTLRKTRSSIDIVRGKAGQTPFPHSQAVKRAQGVRHRAEMDPVVEFGNDHDYTEDVVEDEEFGEERKASARTFDFDVVGDIQRPHSTPPTPYSGSSYVQVPLLPRLPAESP